MKFRIFIFFLLLVGVLAPLFQAVSAEDYRLGVPFPLPGGQTITAISLPSDYIKTFYKFSLGAGALLAMFMIVVGAIQYTLTAGNIGKQQDAIDRIKNAVFGLGLLLSTVFILANINPRTLDLQDIAISHLDVPPAPDQCPPLEGPTDLFLSHRLDPLYCASRNIDCYQFTFNWLHDLSLDPPGLVCGLDRFILKGWDPSQQNNAVDGWRDAANSLQPNVSGFSQFRNVPPPRGITVPPGMVGGTYYWYRVVSNLTPPFTRFWVQGVGFDSRYTSASNIVPSDDCLRDPTAPGCEVPPNLRVPVAPSALAIDGGSPLITFMDDSDNEIGFIVEGSTHYSGPNPANRNHGEDPCSPSIPSTGLSVPPIEDDPVACPNPWDKVLPTNVGLNNIPAHSGTGLIGCPRADGTGGDGCISLSSNGLSSFRAQPSIGFPGVAWIRIRAIGVNYSANHIPSDPSYPLDIHEWR